MNDKKVNQKERKERLAEREELEELIAQSSSNLYVLANEASELAPKNNPIVFDYVGITKMSVQEATDIVESNAKFYIAKEIIDSEEYIQQKIRADIATMTDLLKQSKIAEYAIIRMIELIDEGNTVPRQFEVLAGFQRSKLDLTKTIAQHVVAMEDNYKSIKEDYRNKREESTIEIEGEEVKQENNSGSIITKGTRSMIQNLRKTIDEVRNENDDENSEDN